MYKRTKVKPQLSIQPNRRRKKSTAPKRRAAAYNNNAGIKSDPKVISRSRIKSISTISKVITSSGKKSGVFKTINNNVDHWAGVLSGQPAFILGNSPSISAQPLHLLNQYLTIGINRIFYIMGQ